MHHVLCVQRPQAPCCVLQQQQPLQHLLLALVRRNPLGRDLVQGSAVAVLLHQPCLTPVDYSMLLLLLLLPQRRTV
jgi:hypothetical protein